MLVLYSFGLLLALVVSAPWWLFRMMTSGKYREGLAERLGFIPRRLRSSGGILWVHAVSVGELLAASRLIEELSVQSGCEVMVSTTTRTGQRLARERFGEDRVFYFPLDFAFAVRSWPRYRRLRFLWKHLLNGFAVVLAQSQLDAERLTGIGASNVRVGSNLKY